MTRSGFPAVGRPDRAGDADGTGDVLRTRSGIRRRQGSLPPPADHHHGSLAGERRRERVEPGRSVSWLGSLGPPGMRTTMGHGPPDVGALMSIGSWQSPRGAGKRPADVYGMPCHWATAHRLQRFST